MKRLRTVVVTTAGFAVAMLALAGDEQTPEDIDPAHLADVLEGLAEARRRQFASDAEVEAVFDRFEG